MFVTDEFTQNIMATAKELSPIGYCESRASIRGRRVTSMVFKGTLHQNKDEELFTYVKVDDKFITKFTEVAQKMLDAKFQCAPYLSSELTIGTGAHISLTEGINDRVLAPEDEGKEVYFRLKPIIWDWNHKGSRLNGRILAIVVELLDSPGKKVIDAYNFQTFSPHHITFAMRKMEEEEEKKKTQNLTVPLAKPNMEKKETQANQIQQSHCCIL